MDRAKSIALGHAGVSVSFSKAKLDDDDGRGVYEIEFYVGNTEYEDEMRWKAPSREREGAFHLKKEVMKREICIEL